MFTVVRYCVIRSPSDSHVIEMTSAPVIPLSVFEASSTAAAAASAKPSGEEPTIVITFATCAIPVPPLVGFCTGHNPAAEDGNRRPSTLNAVFDTLSDKLQATLGDLRKRGRLDEDAVSKAMREIRLALLEADVNFGVVKDFVATVRARALGADVLKSLTPGQQVVKIVHEELTALMGSGDSRLAFAPKPPTVILLAGLQGSGKTTAAAKLSLLLRKEGKAPGLVAADLQRPAAIDQLEQLGRQIQVPVYREETKDPLIAVRKGLQRAAAGERDVVIVDTAGRLHVDDALMDELAAVRKEARPTNVLLVLDAMTGQEAVSVAQAFLDRVAFDGVVLTKLDGDARGGAALSVKAITGKPIKLVSLGEKLDQLEYFHPDRMASRILGMGDVLSLIEKAEAAVEADDQAELERRVMAGQFTFDDFLTSYRMLRKMGPLKGVLSMIPGVGKQLQGLDVNEHELARVEAIVLSMTPQERKLPHLINGSRRVRIARGSGTSVQQVNQLLNARKQMEKMMKQMGKGKFPALPAELTKGAPPMKAGRR
jgi:signal recognition particle subunit SRP54